MVIGGWAAAVYVEEVNLHCPLRAAYFRSCACCHQTRALWSGSTSWQDVVMLLSARTHDPTHEGAFLGGIICTPISFNQLNACHTGKVRLRQANGYGTKEGGGKRRGTKESERERVCERERLTQGRERDSHVAVKDILDSSKDTQACKVG